MTRGRERKSRSRFPTPVDEKCWRRGGERERESERVRFFYFFLGR